MRLHFELTPNRDKVPFDYQYLLVGAFHKWMGWNELHDDISLYSIGWLKDAKILKSGLEFPNGTNWFISFWDNAIGKQLISHAMKNPDVCCGMSVKEIQIQDDPNFSTKEVFYLSSPILIRKYDNNRKAIHLTFKDEESDFLLTETLIRKLKLANLSTNINVRFDRDYHNPKTKLIRIKDIENRASMCPIIIEGDSEAIRFAWNVGIGHSTGSGFGAIY